MIVDDSAVVRGMIHNAIKDQPMIEVVASASNGLMAVNTIKRTPADIVLLDIEMPEMDGITALPQILETCPSAKVIMVSTLTQRNAEISLRALGLGASDYVPKPQSRGNLDALSDFYRELISKIYALSGKNPGTPIITPNAPSAAVTQVHFEATKKTNAPAVPPPTTSEYPPHEIKALAIGSSTGGPQALQKLLGNLKGRLVHIPVFITQHMPPTFTTILAQQLAQVSEKACEEAKDGERVAPNRIYVAPGDFHMEPLLRGSDAYIRNTQNPAENYCRPAVDPMLRALSKIYGKHLLVVILTGMGQDGLEGARIAVAEGATVVAQDEASCVVYGMPKAVTDAGLVKASLPVEQLVQYILKACGG